MFRHVLLCGLGICAGAVPSLMAQEPDVANRLANEKSPYLRQHAGNPVHWYPWGEEAFARAKAENKPIFLSVGYSTCHWCHVMERESFEDADIAALLNQDFIAIKVDREERPDVDKVYMTYVQAATGHGGWPMSVFMTPDLKPFFGGTYFPKDDRYGQPGFRPLITAVAARWAQDEAQLVAQSGTAMAELERMLAAQAGDGEPLDSAWFGEALQATMNQYDAEEGGFGSAPKFPRPAGTDLLLQAVARIAADDPRRAQALAMYRHTLTAMADGGIYDHLGGGFHRYSVDRFWHVPHYEKMLYDQGQLAVTYSQGWLATGDPLFKRIVEETLSYVDRDLGLPGGGFAAAEDADSLRPGADHKEEGAFYVFANDELDVELGDDAALFAAAYGIMPDGNSPEGSDPHGKLIGWNTLIRTKSDTDLAQRFNISEAAVAESLAAGRAAALALRNERPRPHRDDKVITAWQGLMISGYAVAARAFGRPDWAERAARAAAFVRAELWDEQSGQLARAWLDGPGEAEGVASDYAYLTQGLLDLYEATGDIAHLTWAIRLQTELDRRFADEADGGWFDTDGEDPRILLRLKEDYDGAEPTPSSVGARNAMRLFAITGDEPWRARAEATLIGFGDRLDRTGHALPAMVGLVDLVTAEPWTLVVVGDPAAADTRALVAEADRRFLPRLSVLVVPPTGESTLTATAPWREAMTMHDGKATAYFCIGSACQAPTSDPLVLARQLDQAN